MNIAEQIKAFHTDINMIVNECDSKAINVEIDDEYGTITYDFVDGSLIVLCGDNVIAYGAK